ncbi:MAG: DUF4389 domain-containing protein [Pseudomonadales bacterium]|jgi:hypothetical protein|nr:DUF4389 domain-containing protein [Pseudomonadales bacterium]
MSDQDKPEVPVDGTESSPAAGTGDGAGDGAGAGGPEPWASRSIWMRALFMVLFVVLYSVAETLVFVIVLLQFLIVLFTGEKNERLLAFGDQVSLYVYDVLRFQTFNSEDRPFPFSDLRSDGPRNGRPHDAG